MRPTLVRQHSNIASIIKLLLQFDDGSNVAVLPRQGWTYVLLRNQGKPKTVRVRVPLLSVDTCHKVVELVCAEEPWCLARCDRSCLWSFDLWYTELCPQGLLVGSPQSLEGVKRGSPEEKAIYCPHCGKNIDGRRRC